MTFRELKKIHPCLKDRDPRDFRKCIGGGWREKSTKVDNTENVQENALILDEAQVLGNAVISGNAVIKDRAMVADSANIRDNATISGNAVVMDHGLVIGQAVVICNALVRGNGLIADRACVCDHALINGYAYITDTAMVGGYSEVHGYVRISGDATVTGGSISGHTFISGGDWKTSPLTITLAPYSIVNSQPKYMSINFDAKPIKEWLSKKGLEHLTTNYAGKITLKHWKEIIHFIQTVGR